MDLLERFQDSVEWLATQSNLKSYVVAYSGGVDSHVLLHLCQRSGINARAIHINHGLQEAAGQWAHHCEQVCEHLNIPFITISVDVDSSGRESPEEAARCARYAALRHEVKKNEILLTAHHLDDQSETLLLQLFRGAGPAGLSSMPFMREVDGLLLARPMLEFSRDDILNYANEQGLDWIEDPSNSNVNFDRNLLRHRVLPLLKERWPRVDQSLLQVAKQQQQSVEIQEAMARIDLETVATQNANVISINALKKLSDARQLNLLWFWLRRHSETKPNANVLFQIIESVIGASDDAEPLVQWGQSEIRRYKDCLYLLLKKNHDDKNVFQWIPKQKLVLEQLGIELVAEPGEPRGLRMDLLNRNLEVRFREGGEKIKPVGRKNTYSVKKLMQEAGIPPWERSRVPMIYDNDNLVCVCGCWLSAEYTVAANEKGWIANCHSLDHGLEK